MLLIASLAARLVFAVTGLLGWDIVVYWFIKREDLFGTDADNIRFTLIQELEKEKIPFILGIFNKRTGKILDGQKYDAKRLDEKLAGYHRDEALVIYS